MYLYHYKIINADIEFTFYINYFGNILHKIIENLKYEKYRHIQNCIII